METGLTGDGIASKYLELITNDVDRAHINLARMFAEIYESEVTVEMYKLFSRLCRLYGSSIVFYAILDTAGMETLDLSNPYPIISFFCKKRLGATIQTPIIDLTDFVNKQKNNLGKKRKTLKVRSLE